MTKDSKDSKQDSTPYRVGVALGSLLACLVLALFVVLVVWAIVSIGEDVSRTIRPEAGLGG